MNKYLELLADILLCAFALVILITLAVIACSGSVKVLEDNPYILYSEIAMAAGAVVLAIERYIRDVRGK